MYEPCDVFLEINEMSTFTFGQKDLNIFLGNSFYHSCLPMKAQITNGSQLESALECSSYGRAMFLSKLFQLSKKYAKCVLIDQFLYRC